jgi:multisubunit Na+/H+ antiporter MnhF subunit
MNGNPHAGLHRPGLRTPGRDAFSRALITHYLLLYYRKRMIDPWFFAALCLGLLAAGALVRVVRIPVLYDRLIAATVTITIAAVAGLSLSIALGNLLVLDATIIIALLGYAVIIASGNLAKEAGT